MPKSAPVTVKKHRDRSISSVECSSRSYDSGVIFQDSIVRVWVEMFTPTLTSTLPVAELAEASSSLSAPSNLYGIRYPFSSICLSASSSRCLAVDISKWNTGCLVHSFFNSPAFSPLNNSASPAK